MRYRVIKVEDDKAVETDLTDGELLGASILLAQRAEPDDLDVYYRAWCKIQYLVNPIIDPKAQVNLTQYGDSITGERNPNAPEWTLLERAYVHWLWKEYQEGAPIHTDGSLNKDVIQHKAFMAAHSMYTYSIDSLYTFNGAKYD